ncbi:MAG: hypothetical protein JNM52_11885 [Betaproteobacteria bacterium]|nr:hypothetical protein [Betaproteobacteria bacterium]
MGDSIHLHRSCMPPKLSPTDPVHKLQHTGRVLCAQNRYPEMADICEAANEILGRMLLSGDGLSTPMTMSASELSEKVSRSSLNTAALLKYFQQQAIHAIPGDRGVIALVIRVHSRDDYNLLPLYLLNFVKPEWRPFLLVLQLQIFRPAGDTQDRATIEWCGGVIKRDGCTPLIFSPRYAAQLGGSNNSHDAALATLEPSFRAATTWAYLQQLQSQGQT